MEWNFVFRIDYLLEHGEERNLKGVIFTDGDRLPTAREIQEFLHGSGYNVSIKDEGHLVFFDSNPAAPLEIRIIRLGNEEDHEDDRIQRLLAEQFRKEY